METIGLYSCRECCGDAEFEQSLARTPMAAAASQLSHGQVLRKDSSIARPFIE